MIEIIENWEAVRYQRDGELHRPNGPAISWPDGSWSWALNDRVHRYYGPAGSSTIWVLYGSRVK